MQKEWLLAGAALLLSLGVQTSRLHERGKEIEAQHQRVRQLELGERTYKRAVLSSLAAAIAVDSTLPARGLYMVVDRRCGACETALNAFRRSANPPEVRVVSFTDSAAVLQDWMAELKLPFVVVEAPPTATFLRGLPRTVTPLYLEFEHGDPVDLHIGQPKEAWLGGGS